MDEGLGVLANDGLLLRHVVVAALRVVLLVVLDDLGGDLVTDAVLLRRPLRGRHRGRNGHARRAAVGDQVRSGRDARCASRRVEVAILAHIRRGS